MHKQEILSLVRSGLETGSLTQDDVLGVVEEFEGQKASPEARFFSGRKKFSAAGILYLIGGIIMLVGVWTFVATFWQDLTSPIRVLLTLGLAIAAFAAGILLRDNEDTAGIALVMQAISGALAPIGLYVTLNELNVTQHFGIGWSFTIALALFVIYGAALFLFRSAVFAVFTTAFGTWALYAGVAYLLETVGIYGDAAKIYEYLTLAVGLGYLFIGHGLSQSTMKALQRTFYTFGSLAVYGSILVLGGYKPGQSVLWELIAILVAVGGLYAASAFQNRTILKTTTLFIFALIAKFTAEYFADSLGWPIALIIGGFVLIGVGFGLLRFGKRMGKGTGKGTIEPTIVVR